MKEEYIITRISHNVLKDPVFAAILNMVAEWANNEGLENKKCTDFYIDSPNEEGDPLHMLTNIRCKVEINKGKAQ